MSEKMRFFRKKKRTEELETTAESMIPEREEKTQDRHAVLEYCQQMMDAARDMEETKREYKTVTDHLADIQRIQELPENEQKKLRETAWNIQNLSETKAVYQKKEKNITEAQFSQMDQLQNEMPKAIRRLKTNEAYQSAVKRDMQYLEGEKSQWLYHQEMKQQEHKILKRVLYGLMAVFVMAVTAIGILSQVINLDIWPPLFAAVLAAGGAGGAVYWRMQNDEREQQKAQAHMNRAITLLNGVKLKYVNITNAVDYACEKYHVKNSDELSYIWQQYLEAVKEREKYQRTSDDLEYFTSRLMRDLHAYHLHDVRVWSHQVKALLEEKEMERVKQDLSEQRERLWNQIDSQMTNIQNAKAEIEKHIKNYRMQENEIREILDSLEEICQGF